MTIESRWDFGDPRHAEQRLRRALADDGAADALVLRTQLARALGLQRRFAEAHAELDRVAAGLAHASAEARTFYHLERGRVLNTSGDPRASTAHFADALAIARDAGIEDLAADAAHMLAIVEPPERQIEWAERALEIARRSSDARARRWIAPVENNLGWTLHELGRTDEALGCFQRALTEREANGAPGPLRIARWSVARCLRTLGRIDEALAIQRALEAEHLNAGTVDGYVFEELAELLWQKGDQASARGYYARVHGTLGEDRGIAAERRERWRRRAGFTA